MKGESSDVGDECEHKREDNADADGNLLRALTDGERDNHFACEGPANGQSNQTGGERERDGDTSEDLPRASTGGKRDKSFCCSGISIGKSSHNDAEREQQYDNDLLKVSAKDSPHTTPSMRLAC